MRHEARGSAFEDRSLPEYGPITKRGRAAVRLVLSRQGEGDKQVQTVLTRADRRSFRVEAPRFVEVGAAAPPLSPLLEKYSPTGKPGPVQWEFGDGDRDSGDRVTHRFAKAGPVPRDASTGSSKRGNRSRGQRTGAGLRGFEAGRGPGLPVTDEGGALAAGDEKLDLVIGLGQGGLPLHSRRLRDRQHGFPGRRQLGERRSARHRAGAGRQERPRGDHQHVQTSIHGCAAYRNRTIAFWFRAQGDATCPTLV